MERFYAHIQNVINSSNQHFSDLCNPFLYLSYVPYYDVEFVDKAFTEKCDYNLFTLQFCYIENQHFPEPLLKEYSVILTTSVYGINQNIYIYKKKTSLCPKF